MRKAAVVLGLSGALALWSVPVTVQAQAGQVAQGIVNGVARDAANQVMQVTMQLRDAAGNLVSAVGTNSAGAFTIAANPGTYTLVMVNSAGQIVGTSAAITVTAGATVTVNVTASALAAAAGGVGAAAAGTGGVAAGTSLGTVAVATAGTVATVAAVEAVANDEASASR